MPDTSTSTATVPTRPTITDAARRLVTPLGYLAVFTLVAYGVLGKPWWYIGPAAITLVIIADVEAHLVQLRRWRRALNAQHVWARLCLETGDPTEARRELMRVKRWRRGMPVDVTILPGPQFDAMKGAAWKRLAAQFAAAVGVTGDRVRVQPIRGRIRLTVTDQQQQRAERQTGTTSGGEGAGEGAPVAAAATTPLRRELPPPEPKAPPDGPMFGDQLTIDDQEPTELDLMAGPVEEAVQAIVEGAKVTIHGANDGRPTDLTIAYPPGKASKAREARAELVDLLDEIATPAGMWHCDWKPAAFIYRFDDRPDPLATLIPPPPIEDDLDLSLGVQLGQLERGQPWRHPLIRDTATHVLVVGASGAGKASPLWCLIRGLSSLIAQGRVRLWIIDPKGGAEFSLARPYAYRFAVKPNDVKALLDEAHGEMDKRAERLAARGMEKLTEATVDEPLDLLIVDELANITVAVAPATRNAIEAHLLAILTMGRSNLWTVVGGVQDPRKDVVKYRALFPFKIGLRLNEPGEVRMALGDGARAGGAICDRIPMDLPGVAYVLVDGAPEPVRVRTAYVDQTEKERLAAALPAIDKNPPAKQAPRRSRRTVQKTSSAGRAGTIEDVGREVQAGRQPVVRFDGEQDDAAILDIVEDPDEPDTRAEVTYRYDGESQERSASFPLDDPVTIVR